MNLVPNVNEGKERTLMLRQRATAAYNSNGTGQNELQSNILAALHTVVEYFNGKSSWPNIL